MIVLVWSCSNSYCQTNSTHSSTGDSTKVLIDISYIRKANIKLIEHSYCNEIISIKDTIINLNRIKYAKMDSIYRVTIKQQYNTINNLEKQVVKTKHKNKMLGGAAIGSIAILVLTLLIK